MIEERGYDEAIERVLFDRAQIAEAIERLATQIARDYRGRTLVMVGVLKGALLAVADLARAVARRPDGPDEILLDYLVVSSYGNSFRSSGEVRLLRDVDAPVTGKDVLLVEDVVDNGMTLAYLRGLFEGRRPATLRSCALFDKPYRRRVEVPIDYVGLVAPDAFIVGYGLDYRELFRNLPYVAQLRSRIFTE